MNRLQRRIGRAVLLGSLTGALLATVLAIAVFATGQTFGQRCERMNPGADGDQIERCVDALAKDHDHE